MKPNYANNYYDADFYYDDTPKFYERVDSGFNDYPPDIVDLVGWGLQESPMIDELGSTQLNTGYDRLNQWNSF